MTKEAEREKAIGTLIACTRRKRRPKSIVEIANEIEFLRNELGSYKAVADRVGLSSEMLREFRSVRFLNPEVRSLVEERIIDSVDLVYRISKLDWKGQKAVIDRFLKEDLTGDDARVIKSFQRSSRKSVSNVISKIIKSRNIRTYIVEFEMPKEVKKTHLQKRFEKIVGKAEIVSFVVNDSKATLELSYRGQKKLREAAKDKGTTLRKFVMRILEEE